MENKIKIFCSEDWVDYELLDTGEGEKLERFGPYTFVRPYEDAVWPKALTQEVQKTWAKADGKFWSSKEGAKSGWKFRNERGESLPSRQAGLLKKWEMSYKGIKFLASPTPFRHLGFFPEQASHWDFIENSLGKASRVERISKVAVAPQRNFEDGRFQPKAGEISRNSSASCPKFLNLFGYTGVASLFALRAGAEVTHVDASKQTLNWLKENQKISGLADFPMRVIEDDVLKFLEREVKRGNKYDAVVMDPPKFGRGPKGETWKIEKDLSVLLEKVRKVLSDKPLFVILTSYAIDSSSLSLGYALEETMKNFGGSVEQGLPRPGLFEAGELCLKEKSKGRLIPLANTALWVSSWRAK